MDLALSIFLFAIVGAAIVATCAWYATAFYDRFLVSDSSPRLGPFEIVGLDDAKAKSLSIALPRMVITRLNSLKFKTNAALKALKEAQQVFDSSAARPADIRSGELEIPEQFIAPIDIDLKIADVELGWLVSLFFERARNHNLLEVTVVFDESGKTAHVYGYHPGRSDYAFELMPQDGVNAVVKEIAAAIIQISAKRQEAALEALNAENFEKIVDATANFARLERTHRFTRSPKPYQALLETIEPQAKYMTGWWPLQWLAARISERAENWEQARVYFGNLQTLTPADRPVYKALEMKLAALDQQLAVQERAEQVAKDKGTTEEAAVQVALQEVKQESRQKSARRVNLISAKPILKALRVEGQPTAAGVGIAVAGGAPWQESVGNAKVQFLDGDDADYGPEDIRNYQTEVLRTARLLAPDGTYLYAPLGGPSSGRGVMQMEDLLTNIERLIGEKKTKVVLFTFVGSSPSLLINSMIRSLADQALFVIAAGNKLTSSDEGRQASVYAGLTDKALVVSSIDLAGRISSFSQGAPNAVWAPGENVPVISATTGEEEQRDGTAFAAALVAGAAGILFAAHPEATPGQVLQAVQETTRLGPAGGEARIVDVAAASASLAKMLGTN